MSRIVTPLFSPHFTAPPDHYTLLRSPHLPSHCPHPNTLPTPLPSPQTHFRRRTPHLPMLFHTPHTKTHFPHLSLHPIHTSPHLPQHFSTPPAHLPTPSLTSPNIFPHSFRISPIFDPTSPTTKNFPIPTPSILSHTPTNSLCYPMLPPFFPISAIMPVSPVSRLRTANAYLFQNKAVCRQVVACKLKSE